MRETNPADGADDDADESGELPDPEWRKHNPIRPLEHIVEPECEQYREQVEADEHKEAA